MLPRRLAHFHREYRQPEENSTGGIGQPPASHCPGRRYCLKVKKPARRRLSRPNLKNFSVILAFLRPQSALFYSLVKRLMRTVSQENISVRTVSHHIPRTACRHSCRTWNHHIYRKAYQHSCRAWNHPVQRTACLHSCRTSSHHSRTARQSSCRTACRHSCKTA
jgi:hypothetical protein